jgi:pimeloyl-ACP methyl ester carboxylesterase
MAELTPRVQQWRDAGEWVEFGGYAIYVHRVAGKEPRLVFLHGFPSSSYDWQRLIHLLSGHACLAFDYLGFGLSDKPRHHRYSLKWQADLAEALIRREQPDRVVLVAHDIGTSIATELMARDLRGELEIPLAAALLFNGSVIQDRASLRPAQRILRTPLGPLFGLLMTERLFRRQFAKLFSNQHPLSDLEAADQWSLITHNSGNRIAHLTSSYIEERLREAPRWHGAVREWPKPLQLCWGLRDPVATSWVLEGLRELRPAVPVAELPDVGHYPQIEAPQRIAGAIEGLLAAA